MSHASDDSTHKKEVAPKSAYLRMELGLGPELVMGSCCPILFGEICCKSNKSIGGLPPGSTSSRGIGEVDHVSLINEICSPSLAAIRCVQPILIKN